MKFPDQFIWGAATAAYQIEGAASRDGKGLSVWDQFCRRPGAIKNGDHADTACDHYRLFPRDIAIMKELKIQGYRLSVSWPRVIPAGNGNINPSGLDYYDRLVDQLLQNGITPYLTLFHWDLPWELQLRGGWLNPDSSAWFADYAETVAGRLTDRVDHWITINENSVFVILGHLTGEHAPGLRLSLAEALQVNHHVLLAHGKAVQTIRKAARRPCRIGMASAVTPLIPASANPDDIELARKANFSVNREDLWVSGIWQDPVYLGSYPGEYYRVFDRELPRIGPDDLKTIAQPVDFVGLNIYRGTKVIAGKGGRLVNAAPPPGYARTGFDWTVVPESLYWGPKFFYERYRKPVIITENGVSSLDWVALDGKIHDPQRIDYTRRYLRELQRAGADGVELAGYFHWSLLDNFEWAEGYKQRFGLVYTDFETGERIIKDSGYWYRDVIASHGENI
jgi:beta-glucosidase